MNEHYQKVFFFGDGTRHDLANPSEVLGCKGANLAEMTRLGLPVPPGYTISTGSCREYYLAQRHLTPQLKEDIITCMERLERITDLALGDPERPLLVSVRSGASVSMPGMMDTVLNLGLNDEVVAQLAKDPEKERFAYDSYRRFIEMYSDIVLGMKPGSLEQLFERMKQQSGVESDQEVSVDDLKRLVELYKQTVWTHTGSAFPTDPYEQLWGAIKGVFESWNNRRAVEYRQLYNIPQELGTAVTIQRMVFGNLSSESATGVALTRDPSTGEKVFYGEYLPNAQGEDVVAGLQTPRPIRKEDDEWGQSSLQEEMPEVYEQLEDVVNRLEQHFGDLQDIEFTVESGKLWMLQTRSGKRSARAAIRIAVEMVREGLITPSRALLQIDPEQLDQLLHPTFDKSAKEQAHAEGRSLARGLPASPGAEVGPITFCPERAVEWAARGRPAILVRTETSPNDIHGVSRAAGVLTSRGGMTSHAAVVARGMGKCCVVGCRDAVVTVQPETLRIGGQVLLEGDILSLDGSTGEVIAGVVSTTSPELGDDYDTLMEWVEARSNLKIMANAHTPHEIRVALQFGASGIGLCRSEHMFTSPDRVRAVRHMILAQTEETRRVALKHLLAMQIEDFYEVFKAVGNRPITMRLLDPPLHVFLPSTAIEIEETAEYMGVPVESVREKIERMRESNPMLGHRGARLAITYPEIYQMQVDAIVRAAHMLEVEDGISITPSLMIPLVSIPKELELIRVACAAQIERTRQATGFQRDLPFGTMIEVPSAVRLAGELARECDFFNFGTNDLTQTTLGISRDDAGRFLPLYINMGLLERDPFRYLHPVVQEQLSEAVKAGRKANPKLKIGICGDHANWPSTVSFCCEEGFDYLSCSPYRVPVVKLASTRMHLEGNH